MVGPGGVRIRAIGVGRGRQRVADGNGVFVEVPGSIPLGSFLDLEEIWTVVQWQARLWADLALVAAKEELPSASARSSVARQC